MSYTSNDDLDGRIHTNDRFLWFCGSPKFRRSVEVAGHDYNPAVSDEGVATEAESAIRMTNLGCTAPGTPEGATVGTSPEYFKTEPLEFPTGLTSYRRLARHSFTGDTEIQLSKSGTDFVFKSRPYGSATAWAVIAATPIPSRGLIYVDGEVRVMGDGTAADDGNGITIMATARLRIGSGLDGDGDELPTSITGADIGLISQADIVIGNDAQTDVDIDAGLLALGASAGTWGTIYVEGWAYKNDPAYAPTFNFRGSLISRFRPLFGTYAPSDGSLRTGLAKNLGYVAQNPPYFLSPVNAAWERLDLSEIPMRSGTNADSTLRPDGTSAGLTPAPADGVASTYRGPRLPGNVLGHRHAEPHPAGQRRPRDTANQRE